MRLGWAGLGLVWDSYVTDKAGTTAKGNFAYLSFGEFWERGMCYSMELKRGSRKNSSHLAWAK